MASLRMWQRCHPFATLQGDRRRQNVSSIYQRAAIMSQAPMPSILSASQHPQPAHVPLAAQTAAASLPPSRDLTLLFLRPSHFPLLPLHQPVYLHLDPHLSHLLQQHRALQLQAQTNVQTAPAAVPRLQPQEPL